MSSLFVYGSIADESIQLKILGHICKKNAAILRGYERRMGKWAYVLPKVDSVVEGWLIEGLSDAEVVKLDEYEKADSVPGLADPVIYERREVSVYLPGGEAKIAWAYFPILEKWLPEWRSFEDCCAGAGR
ncbi:MAG: gamma-glutamylcyclotransferase [Alphaproteobacteria bacterium]|nr:gamma-glutamylcyclotransferase [Alphaproteobacteria bacterium]